MWHRPPTGPAPVIDNGLVWVVNFVDTGTPSTVLAYDLSTGALRWSGGLSCAWNYDTDNYDQWTNLAIADGRLFAPTLCGVSALSSAR